MHKNKILEKKTSNFFCNFLRKKLIKGKKHIKAGRNNQGFISVRHQGGQATRILRIINFHYFVWNCYGIVLKFIYDPNRTAPLMLICYFNGILSYHLAIKDFKVGDFLLLGAYTAKIFSKKITELFNVKAGTLINNIEFLHYKGSKIARAAGTSAQMLKVDLQSEKVLIRMPSKEERLISIRSVCCLGQIANYNHFLLSIDKAGRNRHLGIRPTVRGVAMNPVDHPHGGGQGKTSGAGGFRSQVTFKGKVAKTQPTRPKSKKNLFILKSRKVKN